MAKSPSEQIRELAVELVIVREQDGRQDREIEILQEGLREEEQARSRADVRQHEEVAELRASHKTFQNKTGDELHKLTVELRILTERDAARDKELSRLRAEVDEERKARIALEKENAVLRQQFQDHLAQYQETDRRRWGLMGLFIGAILSLGSGLVVALVKK